MTNWMIEDRCQFLLANCISVQLDCFLLLVSQGIVSVGPDSSDNTWEKSGDYSSARRIHRIITLFNIAFKHQFAMFALLRLSHCFPELQ